MNPHSANPNTEQFWDKVAQHATTNQINLGTVSSATVEATKAYLSKEQSWLDFGCGTGDIMLSLAPEVGHAHAIDSSSAMVSKAKDKARHANDSTTRIEHLSLHDTSLPIAGYDAITAFNILHYLTDLEADLQRIHDLLKPGGYFISSTACVRQKWSLLRLLLRLSMMLGWVPKMQYFKSDELRTLIESAGFDVVEHKDLSKLPDHFIVGKKHEDTNNRVGSV